MDKRPYLIAKILKNTHLTKKQKKILSIIKKNTEIRKTIPDLLHEGKVGKKDFLIENYLEGKRIIPDYNKVDFHFQQIVEWLQLLNSCWSRKINNKEIQFWLGEIKHTQSSISLGNKKIFIKKFYQIAKEKLKKIKLFISNGDFTHSNILINQDLIKVLELDEYCENLPLFDFFSFTLSYYSYLISNKKINKKFSDFLEEIKNKDYVKTYLEEIKVARDFYFLLSLFLIDRIIFYSKIKNTIPKEFLDIHIKSFKANIAKEKEINT